MSRPAFWSFFCFVPKRQPTLAATEKNNPKGKEKRGEHLLVGRYRRARVFLGDVGGMRRVPRRGHSGLLARVPASAPWILPRDTRSLSAGA